MTAAEWENYPDPQAMLASIDRIRAASGRKLYLFACACHRRFWPLLTDTRCRAAVEAAERVADGELDDSALEGAAAGAADAEQWLRARRADGKPSARAKGYAQWQAAVGVSVLARGAHAAAVWAGWHGALAAKEWAKSSGRAWKLADLRERAAQRALLRDIVGNPFRPVPFDPAWRSENAVLIARQIYESRDFSGMPVLADALEEAGCDHDEVLAHCRGTGPHVRGCWVADLVLDKA